MIDIKQYDNVVPINPIGDGFAPGYGVNLIDQSKENPNEFKILFPNLYGYARTFRAKDENQKWEVVPKYLNYNIETNTVSKPQPGQGLEVFITKEILNKYKDKKPIKTLVLSYHLPAVYWANKIGIDCIGVPEWDLWDKANTTELFSDIYEIITACNVESIALMMDNNIFSVEWKQGLDLYTKPKTLYRVIERFKYSLREYHIPLYWNYVHPDLISYDGTFYGLLKANTNSPELIATLISDFENKTGPRRTMVRQEITKMGLNQIKELFGIHKDGAEFFEKYRSVIQLEEFVYNKQVYQYNIDRDRAEFVSSAEAKSFIAVGGAFYRQNVKQDEYKYIFPKLDRFPAGGFSVKFPHYSKEKIERLKKDIPYFDSFGNWPEHINYQPSWTVEDEDSGNNTKFYNIYNRIYHKPKKGDCSLSLSFVKHVFGTHTILHKGQTIHGWELGLDYMKILYEKPTEFLPILCLISSEQKTGKSSYPEWIKAIFQENVIKVPAADLSSRFTAYFISKLLIYIEEALISKKEDVEKLKDLVVSTIGKYEEKGLSPVEVNTYLKVILTSNNERSFAPIGDEDVRFWIRKLHTIEGGPKYDFKRNLYSEIPAFLYYLQDRPFTTEWEDRGWFNKALIHTDELKIIRESTKSGNESLIREAIMNYMLSFGLLYCELTLKDINSLIDEHQFPKSKLSYYLNVVLGIPCRNIPHYYKFNEQIMMTTGMSNTTVERSGRTYCFLVRDFFSPFEIFNEFYLSRNSDMYDEENDTEKDAYYIKLEDLVQHEKLEVKRGITKDHLLANRIQSEWLKRITYYDKQIPEVEKLWDLVENNSFLSFLELIKKLPI